MFQTTIQVNHQKIAQLVKLNWNLQLGKILQASQNHTFQAKLIAQNSQQLFSVRVTPDPHKKNIQKIQDEITFVRYLSQHKLNHICGPIKKTMTSDQYFFADEDLIVCVFQWAKGQMLNFLQYQWMTNKTVVNKWGQFFAQLHKISRQFQKQNAEVAKRIQRWDQMHRSIQAGTKLHSDDQKDLQNPQHYGVLHGDLNCKNFHYEKATQQIYVFDTDQVQRGFFLWDLSQAIFTVYMLEHAGMPGTGASVPEANRKQFQQWIVEGYQSVTNKGSVDLQRLNRMVIHSSQYYFKFSKKALEQGNVPVSMKYFCEYIVKNFGDKVQ